MDNKMTPIDEQPIEQNLWSVTVTDDRGHQEVTLFASFADANRYGDDRNRFANVKQVRMRLVRVLDKRINRSKTLRRASDLVLVE